MKLVVDIYVSPSQHAVKDFRGFNFDKLVFVCFVFSLMRVGEGSKYHYKRAIIGPPAKRHCLNGVSLVCRLWNNIECWLGSFEILRGSGPVLLKPSIL